jgi:trimethylamine corrinoid protein
VEPDLEQLRRALAGADPEAATGVVRALLDAGVDPRAILEEGMSRAMLELGERWKRGEVFLPEVVASAEVFRRCHEIVEPALLARREEEASPPVVVMATVQGDIHDLGKNMVAAMLRTAGFTVHDLGRDVPADRIVEVVRRRSPAIVGLSALLTTTVPHQATVIARLEAEGLRDRVKVMVGGAPVTPEWAARIGADGYGANAAEAVEVARELVGARA